MLYVPATIESSPGATVPSPTAAAVTSCRPAATGNPSGSPVASAASAVTVPATSAGPRIGGNRSCSSGMP